MKIRKKAFTLVELMVVVGILIALAGIIFGVQKGVFERAAIAKAKSEISIIAAALESYKNQYGDYPWIVFIDGEGSEIYEALLGERDPKHRVVTGKPFLDMGEFTISNDEVIVDPWGNQYYYSYKSNTAPNAWNRAGFILMSYGPDKEPGALRSINHIASNNGILPDNYFSNEEAKDNIIYGESN